MTKRIPPPWGAMGAAVAIAAAIVSGVRLLAGYLPPPADAAGMALLDAGLTIAMFGLLAACGLAGARRQGSLSAMIGPRPAAMAGLGAVLGLGGLLAAFAYASISGAAVAVRGSSAGAGLLLLGTLATIVQAGGEEIYFRGWLQRALGKAWGPVAGVLATALIFAALHLAGGVRAPLSLVNLFLGGLFFGLLAQRTGGVAASIGAHLLWNWSETLLLGLDPNPGVGSFGALFDHDLAGSALWGGSAEGLNASIAVTLVMVALLIPLMIRRRTERVVRTG